MTLIAIKFSFNLYVSSIEMTLIINKNKFHRTTQKNVSTLLITSEKFAKNNFTILCRSNFVAKTKQLEKFFLHTFTLCLCNKDYMLCNSSFFTKVEKPVA